MREIIEPIKTQIFNSSAPNNPHACGGRKINHKFTELTRERVLSHWSYNDPLIEGNKKIVCSILKKEIFK